MLLWINSLLPLLDMAQAIAYSASEEKMMESEQEPEMDGVDPWKAAMQVWYGMVWFVQDEGTWGIILSCRQE